MRGKQINPGHTDSINGLKGHKDTPIKPFKSLFAAAALTVALAGVSHAAPTPDTDFSFVAPTSTDAESTGASNVQVANTTTTVNVTPYLYVTGALGGTFTVDGYGGQFTAPPQSLTVLHNAPFKVITSGFGNPKNTDPNADAANSEIQSESQLSATTANPNSAFAGTNPFTATSNLNQPQGGGTITKSGPQGTGGTITLSITQRLTVSPQNEAGIYVNTPTVIFDLQ